MVNTYDLGIVSDIQRIGGMLCWQWNGRPFPTTLANKIIDAGETCINRQAGTPEKQRKQKYCSTSSNMLVIIYCYIGCEDEVTT